MLIDCATTSFEKPHAFLVVRLDDNMNAQNDSDIANKMCVLKVQTIPFL